MLYQIYVTVNRDTYWHDRKSPCTLIIVKIAVLMLLFWNQENTIRYQ